MILDPRITEFVQDHPGDWQEVSTDTVEIRICAMVIVSLTSTDRGVRVLGRKAATDEPIYRTSPILYETTIEYRVVRVVCDALSVVHSAPMDSLPSWLVEPVRVELRRRANDLLALSGAPTIASEISPDSQALEDARAVLRGAMAPAILPSDLVEIGIITDRKGIRVTIDKGGYRLFTSRYVQPDQLIGAFEDASQFIIDWMPYDDGGSALKSVRDWIKRLSVVPDLCRILGVTV